MNNEVKECTFCTPVLLENHTIRRGDLVTSLVPKHQFRKGHILVIPNRHVITPAELQTEESADLVMELGRLCALIDDGFGTGIMQKYQPLQAENGIKMNHLHFHAFPRVEDERVLFPVPVPNSFEGLILTSEIVTKELVEKLK